MQITACLRPIWNSDQANVWPISRLLQRTKRPILIKYLILVHIAWCISRMSKLLQFTVMYIQVKLNSRSPVSNMLADNLCLYYYKSTHASTTVEALALYQVTLPFRGIGVQWVVPRVAMGAVSQTVSQTILLSVLDAQATVLWYTVAMIQISAQFNLSIV